MTTNGPIHRFTAPSRALLWTEHLRASAETAGYLAALPSLALGHRGDGHSVLVLPGLLADDSSTVALRHLLRRRGYRPHAWGLGRNLGPTRHITDGLVARLDEVHARSGRPVSLVGWSLGGILARELTRLAPEKVRCVITLGSPFRLTVDDAPTSTHAGLVFDALKPWHTGFLARSGGEEDRPELGVPATSIYSRLDGVVPWQACQDLPGPQRENVEVTASHLGMGVHPQVLEVVLDRLGQPVGAWQRYGARVAA